MAKHITIDQDLFLDKLATYLTTIAGMDPDIVANMKPKVLKALAQALAETLKVADLDDGD